MVVLWHMKLVTNQVFDIVQPAPDDQKVHTEITALSVEFDINDQLMQDPASIVLSYGYSSNFQEGPPEQIIATEVAAPTGTGTTGYWRTNPARNIAPCDPALNVQDQGCLDTENTFSIKVYVEIPITITRTLINQQPTVVPPAVTTLGIEFFFAYDFTQDSWSDDMQPPGIPWSVFHTEVIIPQGYGTPSVATYDVNYTLTAKEMVLNYFPLTTDARASTGAWGGYTAITNNLAQSGSQWLLHANNQLQPTVEGADVSSSFKAWRYVRSWLAPVGADGNRSAPYAGAVAPGAAIPTWMPDNAADDSGEIQPGWFDVPAGPSLVADPSQWPTVRQLDEFVATVLNYPEFGLIYYMVVWDVKPNAYRIRAYPSQSITVDDWCTVKASGAPNIDEGTWQPPVAALNAASVMVDTGWVDSQGNPTS